MQITGFEKTMSQQWENACNGTNPVIQVTLFSIRDRMSDEQFFLPIANGVLKKMGDLGSSIKCNFLGATHSTPFFPQLAFSCPTKEDGQKVFGVLIGHFVDHPNGGYDIRMYS